MSHRKSLLLLAILVATSATGVALAAAPAGAPPPPPAGPASLDTNGDGVVDRQEAAANPRLASRFDQLDKNKDGKLSSDEMPQWRNGGHRQGGHSGNRGHRGGDHGRGMLAAMDTNKDGRVSSAEYRAYFDKLDVNKDGFIDKADREARAAQRRAEWFANADTNKDGKLSPAELEAARTKAMEHRRHDNPRPRPPMPPMTPKDSAGQ